MTDTRGAVAVFSLSLHSNIEIQATRKIVDDTTRICSPADLLIAISSYLSLEAETSNSVTPSEHGCVVATHVLLGNNRWRAGSYKAKKINKKKITRLILAA